MPSLNQAQLLSMATMPATLEAREMLRSLIDIQDDEGTMFDYCNYTQRIAPVPVGNPEYFHFLNILFYSLDTLKD